MNELSSAMITGEEAGPAARFLTAIEPCGGAVIRAFEMGDVDREVRLARAAWPDWAARPLAVRIELARRFANVLRNRSEQLVQMIAREIGKPLWEARDEIESAIARVDISAAALAERTARRQSEGALGARNSVRHKPHGVLGILTPYCSPVDLPCSHIIPALIAGNTLVFKPSPKAAAVAELLVACIHEAGIPEGAVRLLIGDAAEGQALAAHPEVSGILFTGSTSNGLALNRQMIEMPARLAVLEMGGNNPIVVWDTPDVATSASIVVQSAFLSAGQRCTAARRLIVRDGDHEPLLDQIRKLASRLIVDEPFASPQPFMGPMVDNEAADAVNDAFLDLVFKGGRALLHMSRPDPARPFLTPGMIDVTAIANRADVEIFGPLLQVVRVPDFDAAIAEANATRYGLSASLIGRSAELYNRFWANIHAGSINWNRPTNMPAPALPFGGLGLSGNHRPSGQYAADYCAYPVISSENEQLRTAIGIGLRDA